MVRGTSRDLAASTARATNIGALANTKDGSTNATALTAGLSGFWQEDTEQGVIPLMLRPQSRCESVSTGAAFR